ncbi:hypothetical protein [Bradyrhizobium sp.]|uniref:hypothetical protein n=1 Tax=Bradyrhizobium sp. TaxID=376 RepID=UPI003C7117D8
MKLTTLESNVLEMLLAGEEPELATLRVQAGSAQAADRNLSGVGFYTKFAYPSEQVPLPSRPTFDFGDVKAESPKLAHGAGFVLFVRGGVLDALEGYTYDDPWPTDEASITLSYEGGVRKRDAVMQLIRGAGIAR